MYLKQFDFYHRKQIYGVRINLNKKTNTENQLLQKKLRALRNSAKQINLRNKGDGHA